MLVRQSPSHSLSSLVEVAVPAVGVDYCTKAVFMSLCREPAPRYVHYGPPPLTDTLTFRSQQNLKEYYFTFVDTAVLQHKHGLY